jgi:hypothetical protein
MTDCSTHAVRVNSLLDRMADEHTVTLSCISFD